MKSKRAYLLAFGILSISMAIYFATRPMNPTPSKSAITVDQGIPSSSPEPNAKPVSVSRPPPLQSGLSKTGFPGGVDLDKGSISRYLSRFMTPISFYGKVVDDKGNPIEGANVKFTAADQTNPYGKNSQYIAKSAEGGIFSISGIHGARLYVDVSKDGYYKTPAFDGHRGSSDGFPYAGLRDNNDPAIPTADKPATFVLRKRGEATPLVRVTERCVMVPKDGSPVKISLQTGKLSPEGELTIECWTQDQIKDSRGRYPWLCQVSVPGGGLAKRYGEFDFEAPANGYQTFDEIAPPPDRWVPDEERQYFVKTADNHYARITVNMIAGGAHFATIESYFNPTPGERNLEYDPKLSVKIP